MGVDTRLLINSKWEIEDVRDILEHHFNIKAKMISRASSHSTYYQLDCDNGRTINCHYNQDSPIGNCVLLSLHSDKQGIKILQQIATVTGGFLNEEDFNEKYKQIMGMFWDEDGLSYHYKYAAVHNELASNADIEGLTESVKKWCKKHKQQPMVQPKIKP